MSGGKYGDYVVPFDLPGGPPRGFQFDGDTMVPDVHLENAARHDWDYLTGAGRFGADCRYAARLALDHRCVRALVRWVGLTLGGWVLYGRHTRRRKLLGLQAVIAERMIPHHDQDVWDWPVRTWLLKDLKRKTISAP